MSGMFCNHLLSWVGPSFAKHSTSFFACLLSTTLLDSRTDINHPLPHLRWNRRGGEKVPKEERKRWDRRKWEKGVEKKKRCGSEKLGAFMPHFTVLNYHNSCTEAGIENSEVSLGVNTHHNIPLAATTHFHQSITPHTAHNDWLFWSRLKAVTPGLRWSSRAHPFTKKHKESWWGGWVEFTFENVFVHQVTWNGTERYCMSYKIVCFVSSLQGLLGFSFTFVIQRRLTNVIALCSMKSERVTQHLFRCTKLQQSLWKQAPPSCAIMWFCFARLMSYSSCKQIWQVWSYACALPTKFD